MRRCVLAALVLALFPASARADFIATFDDTSTSPAGIRAVNATTGAAVSVPPGVNDPLASEFHPSLSPDGRFLVFKRLDRGTARIIMVERATGRSVDLFTLSEGQADPQNTPTFSADGTKVLTGRRFGPRRALLTETDVRSFPTPPFPHRVFEPRDGSATGTDVSGRTLHPVDAPSGRFVYGLQFDGGNPPGQVYAGDFISGGRLADPSRQFAAPTLGGVGTLSGRLMVFTSTPVGGSIAAQLPARSKLVSFTLFDGLQITDLPAVVNASNAVLSNPEFTRDGRYLAFVRNGRLFIWDTQTQLLLNSTGVPASPDPTEGGLALEVRRLINSTVLTSSSVSFSLATGSGTGLLVQRIVGRRKLFGRRAPKLRKAGRIPLGTFRKGRHRKRYKLAVRGHKLRSGCYLVTVRALTRKKKVRDLSKPYTVRIRKHRRPRVRRGVRLSACRRGKR